MRQVLRWAAFAAAFGVFAGPVAAQEKLKIGLIVTLSGPAAALGVQVRDGFNLAVKDLGGKMGGRDDEDVCHRRCARMSTAAEISERESGLKRGLSKTQIVMIGLGGAIGTGLFMGSGLAIGYAGPAVILSYIIAGFVALVMVFSLSEMAVVHPTAGFFGTYAETYLNPWVGFVVRYTYWVA